MAGSTAFANYVFMCRYMALMLFDGLKISRSINGHLFLLLLHFIHKVIRPFELLENHVLSTFEIMKSIYLVS